MTFEIPNLPASATALQTAASTFFSCDMQALVAAQAGNGVVSGCGLTQTGTPDMNVVVAAGVIRLNGVNYAVTGGNAAVGSNASGNPRIDLISVDDNDTITVTAGTAAATPDAPEIPADNIYLGLVYVANGETALIDAEIFNRQVIVENPYAGADGFKFTDPTQYSWTALNHGSGSYDAVNNNRVVVKEASDGTTDVRGWYMTPPVSAPYTVTAYIKKNFRNISTNGLFFGHRDNTTGELLGVLFAFSTSISNWFVSKFNSPTSFNSSYVQWILQEEACWIRIIDDNVNLTWEVSSDGTAWYRLHQAARLDFVTPDRVAFGVYTATAVSPDITVALLSMEFTT